MYRSKIAALLLIIMAAVLVLTACGGGACQNHADNDGDGLCEECGKAVEKNPSELKLIENGEVKFQIVLSNEAPNAVKKSVENFKKLLEDFDVELTVVNEDERDKITSCEVLVGRVKNRGADYDFQGKRLGEEGKAIKLIGTKVIIAGGSTDALVEAFEDFTEDILGIDEDSDSVYDASIKKEQCYEKPQDDYDLTGAKIAGNDMRDYVLSLETESVYIDTAASEMQTNLYKKTGIWLEIEKNSTAEKKVVLREVENAGANGFRVYVKGDDLFIDCAYLNKINDAVQLFLNRKITSQEGEVEFTEGSDIYTQDISVVYYQDFGAKGDGKTNDFNAIRSAHDFANISGQTVKGKSGATYYIGSTGGYSAIIKTDVDWTGVSFIFDDRSFDPTTSAGEKDRLAHVFTVVSDYETVTHDSDSSAVFAALKNGISTEATNIGYAPGYKVMYVLYNEDRRMYCRSGNPSKGSAQHELILVDEYGNIDPSTKLLFDYEKVTSIVEYRADDSQLTITGGKITTIANATNNLTPYYERNIQIYRSNTVIDGLKHEITKEDDTGSPYHGIVSIYTANNVRVQNATFQAHKTYKNGTSNMGTYDISIHLANNIYFYNCDQSNFFKADGTRNTAPWGVMGSNYSKNITYDTCVLSRLDAHAGVYNATIINSKVIHIRLIGGGTFRIENSEVYNNMVVSLREDYGATWRGDIEIINTKVMVDSHTINVIESTWDYNKDFGYSVHLPKNVRIDGLHLASVSTQFVNIIAVIKSDTTPGGDYDASIPGEFIGDDTFKYVNKNPLTITETVSYNNINYAGDMTSITVRISPDIWLAEKITVVPFEK